MHHARVQQIIGGRIAMQFLMSRSVLRNEFLAIFEIVTGHGSSVFPRSSESAYRPQMS